MECHCGTSRRNKDRGRHGRGRRPLPIFMTRLCGGLDFPIEFLCAGTHIADTGRAASAIIGETSMTALVLQNLATLSAVTRSLRMLLTRSARAIDALVSARAARHVPEWQMQEVQSRISHYCGLISDSRPIRPVERRTGLRSATPQNGNFLGNRRRFSAPIGNSSSNPGISESEWHPKSPPRIYGLSRVFGRSNLRDRTGWLGREDSQPGHRPHLIH